MTRNAREVRRLRQAILDTYADPVVTWAYGREWWRLAVLEMLRPLPLRRRLKNVAWHWSRS